MYNVPPGTEGFFLCVGLLGFVFLIVLIQRWGASWGNGSQGGSSETRSEAGHIVRAYEQAANEAERRMVNDAERVVGDRLQKRFGGSHDIDVSLTSKR